MLQIGLVSAEPAVRVVIESEEWGLVGDLLIPDGHDKVPAVLMLN